VSSPIAVPDSGVVIVDKPAGLTSHDVVARIRRLAGTRKVGHAGTLDPMATGVLVVGINRATRLLGYLSATNKAYDATIRLGLATITDDSEGDPVGGSTTHGVTETQVRDALAGFVGSIEQRPSAVSAIKIDGKRAHQRVREGEEVVLQARAVTIHELQVHQIRREADSGGGEVLDVDVSVACSSGTYIRAIARDLGELLSVGGHLTALRRTSVGAFGLAQASTLEELAEDFSVLPIEGVARASFTAHDLDSSAAADVRVGRRLDFTLEPGAPVAMFAPDGEFLALYAAAGSQAKAVAVFVSG
jgi:tRNA pseudouridine55 synthase